MRKSAKKNAISLKAYAGTTGVLLAFDVPEPQRQGLLGFAIEKQKGGVTRWLNSMLHFPGIPHTDGDRSPTNVAPIQKFRWSDYTALPDTAYTYTVHPVYGTPKNPRVDPGVKVSVKTHGSGGERHFALFNRAVAASQAFRRDFPEVEAALDAARKAKLPPPELPARALAWLTRGLLEQIEAFIARAADSTWALDIAIYEYELPAIVNAVYAAETRGAHVRIVYHAKVGDAQTAINAMNVKGFTADRKVGRVTKAIFHDKFIVLSKTDGTTRSPQAVLAGSTNFTQNGVYRQANVVHVVREPAVAKQYLDIFETLFSGTDVARTKKSINATNPISFGNDVFVGFSPRSKRADLDAFIGEVNKAKRDVLFCTAFGIYDPLLDAFLGQPNDPILRFGIQNTRSTITGYHRDRTANFAATAMLDSGLEGFLKESTAGQEGNILIHTKLIVVDFTSATPTVISGSHNFSVNASERNDENFLVIKNQPDLADCYGVELMRIYDHYRFRWKEKGKATTKGKKRELTLTGSSSWTDRYYTPGSLEDLDRRRFA